MAVTWTTPVGLLFTASIYSVVAESVTATNATNYEIISGGLPEGLAFNSSGTISGTVAYIENSHTSTFVVRATDTDSLRDRTFSIGIVKYNEVSWDTSGFVVENSVLKKLLVNRD